MRLEPSEYIKSKSKIILDWPFMFTVSFFSFPFNSPKCPWRAFLILPVLESMDFYDQF